MAENYTQANRPIKVKTPLAEDALLLERFAGAEAISAPFRFQLDLLAEPATGRPLRQAAGPAGHGHARAAATSRAATSTGSSRSFSEPGADAVGEAKFNRFRAEVVPAFWPLTRTSRSRIFQQLSVVDILKKVLTGLTVDYAKLQGTFEPRDYCVQYRETDFDFASRLMEEEGIFYFFTHADGSHTMVLADTAPGPPRHPRRRHRRLLAVGRRRAARSGSSSWEKTQEVRSGKYTLWDHNFELPDKNLEASQTTLASVAVGTVTHKLKVGGNDAFELYDYPGGYAQRFDGIAPGGGDQASELQKIFDDNTRTVGIRMQQEAVAGLVVSGAGQLPAVRRRAQVHPGRPLRRQRRLRPDPRRARGASVAGSYQTGQAGGVRLSRTRFAASRSPCRSARSGSRRGPGSPGRRRPSSSGRRGRRSSPTSTAA